ncbi:MAG: polysaccharide biosynthesis protein [Mucilaginibacter sp.]|uniref:MATE family efflux transporter n=1 Tax=Mucilaginibacter sp. TaxID=1882438 RepID=UPI002610F9CF|nr:MATE family efflux transporter [Mucilaginibacter sp.]MDB5003978.1 polysaccharide biosynthesis protein [Mucilaginibacter sp.]
MSIIQSAKKYWGSLIGSDKALTGKVNFNIAVSFALRGISIIISFLIVPYSLKLLDTNKYGIWLAISSTVSWISILDIGLANGLRNKVAEYIAKKEYDQAKIAVSSTYAILLLIILPIAAIFSIAAPFINWNSVFKTTLDQKELLYTLITVFTGLSFQFILKPISSILQGDQKIYKSNQIQLICNFVPLIPIILLGKYLQGSMFFLAIAQTLLPVIVLLIYTIILFKKSYADIAPSIKRIDLKKSKSLFQLSIAFFIVQIAGVFLYSTTEIIVAREFGGGDVAIYVSLYKYYSATSIILNIVLATYWSAFTNAFALNDIEWIRSSITKLLKIAALFLIVIVLQVLLAGPVFKIWVGDKIKVPFTLSIGMAVYFSVTMFTLVYTVVLNGTGKVKMQSIISIITAVLHIPVVLFFIRYLHLGLNSIIYASILWTVIQVILWKKEIGIILNTKTNKLDVSDVI